MPYICFLRWSVYMKWNILCDKNLYIDATALLKYIASFLNGSISLWFLCFQNYNDIWIHCNLWFVKISIESSHRWFIICVELKEEFLHLTLVPQMTFLGHVTVRRWYYRWILFTLCIKLIVKPLPSKSSNSGYSEMIYTYIHTTLYE